ncbi:Crp/Fnr family transcriptional regulator [Sphingomicrobium lutaoense]|uniref:CRP-like cAMP-binding protein n=1 Tax=Sphingomicrobium lutaoense TaxID=515949 RepID=A0A839Z600_9SPHN|nr:Crp/Fnr family transcriptional regulator [Sphingomicrobium lutaoense]MBB3765042.1 CRP-like cAMP-binding protein [Sphingomicrobium lutaoense]
MAILEARNDADIDFGSNRLLDLMPRKARDELRAHGRLVHMEVGDRLFHAGKLVDQSYFPLDSTTVSLMVELDDDERRVEVASIGSEGAIGGIVSCGDLPAFTQAQVQVEGSMVQVPMGVMDRIKDDSPMVRELYCRYADFLLAQVMQSVACNAFHPIEARAARWLMTAQDRAGDRLKLTQDALAGLLGVQRTTINAVARQLQDEGMIEYRRGVIRIVDRDALEKRACGCYASLDRHFDKVIGDRNAAWMEQC